MDHPSADEKGWIEMAMMIVFLAIIAIAVVAMFGSGFASDVNHIADAFLGR